MNTTALLFSVVNGLIYYDMLEFNDLKCEAFKETSTAMQLLYMFQEALRMVNEQYADSRSVLGRKRRIVPQSCDVSSNNFVIRLRVYEIEDVSYPVYWFSAQSAAYRLVRDKSRSLIKVEYKQCAPSFVEVVYQVWFDEPIPF